MSIPGSILGTRVLRTEDPGLLRGERRYVADLDLPGKVFAAFARAPIAHGLVRAVHVDEARDMPGVVAVWTATEAGIAPLHGFMKVHDDFARAPLAHDRVRFVGDALAVVFAETSAQAEDAAEAVWADIDPLPVHTDPERSLAPGAELVFPDHGTNEAMALHDKAVADLEATSDVIVRGRFVNQRMAVGPIEVNCVAAAPVEGGRVRVWPATQMPHALREQLANALGWDEAELHIVTPQVGGGFGGKSGLHPEFAVVVKAARDLDRPVVWIPTRSEDMHTLTHSRGQVQYVELGCTRDGRFTGLRVRLVGDAGAYPTIGTFLPGGTRRMSQGTYDFPVIQFDIAVGVTNTTPMGAYRGAGRPEATALVERIVDQAAHELGIDPIVLRERNLLGDDRFPFRTLTGNLYDSGRYTLPLHTAADAIGYAELRAEQQRRRADHGARLLGIGVAAYVEITAGGGSSEFGAVEVHADGSATVFAGTSAHGQGHQTAYAMVVSDQTGIPVERITLVDGDTDRVPRGGGTGGSRSLQLGGSAVRGATEALVAKAKLLAADLLEAAVDDLVVDTARGTIGVAGVPSSELSWARLAEQAPELLAADFIFDQGGASFPFGAHIAVVEVDPETGQVELLREVAVDDCGTVLSPVLVEGQQHGGVAAGAGQALFEEIRYDEAGNLLTANFADYCMATAADLPSFEPMSTETPSPLNPLGAKGIGEASTIGSTPAVQNAVIDALAHLGVRHLDMPCTPMRVWQAVRDAAAGTLADPWRTPPDVFGSAAEVDEAAIDAAEGI